MADTPKETVLLRISSQAHAMLTELANEQKRTLGGQAEVLIEAEWHATRASNPPVASVPRPFASANRQPAIPLGS